VALAFPLEIHGKARYENDGQSPGKRVSQGEAVHSTHGDIGYEHIDLMRSSQLQGLNPVRCFNHFKTAGFQHNRQEPPETAFVFHE